MGRDHILLPFDLARNAAAPCPTPKRPAAGHFAWRSYRLNAVLSGTSYYDEDRPVVCFDESNKQLVGEIRTPIPCKPGAVRRIDDEYVRNGVANIYGS